MITCIGATIGKTGLASVSCAINQQINAAVPTGVEPEFLYWFIVSPGAQNWIITNASATTLPILNKGRLAAMPVALAPANEQRRIVAKVEALQSHSRRAREALDAVPPLLEKLRQSILAAAFRGDLTADWRAQNPTPEPASVLLTRIRAERRRKWEEAELAKLKAKGKAPNDNRWKAKYREPEPVDSAGLPELPNGWCWATWGEVGFSQNGRAFPSAEYSATGTKLLRPGNLHVAGHLEWTAENTRRMPMKWEEEFPEFVVSAGELLVNLTAQSLKDEFLGRVCLSGVGERCLLNQRIARLTPVGMRPEYWLWFFKSPSFRRYVDTLNTGSLIQHMFTTQLDATIVPLMPLTEAEVLVTRISAEILALERIAAALHAQRDQLARLDRATLAKAFRGELVPQDPNHEPGDVMVSRHAATAAAGAARPRTRRSEAAE